MAPSVGRRSLAAALATVLAGFAFVGLGSAPAGAAANKLAPGALCKKLTPAMVSKVLGVKATGVTPQVSGTQTVCWYKVGTDTTAVYVRAATSYTKAKFNADQKLSAATNQHPKKDTKFGALPAFSSSLSSPISGTVYSVTVLKGTAEIQAGATKVSLAKVEALAKQGLSLA